MKIAVAGIGYVGLANAILLAQNHDVIAVDTVQRKVDMVNARKSPLEDKEIKEYLANRPLRLTATVDSSAAYREAELVIIATPTNYDFIYLSDAGEAFYLLGEFGKPGRRYNIASGEGRLLKDYLTQVRDVVAPGCTLRLGENPSDVFFLEKSSFDISTLREDTGFSPEVSFAEGIRRTARWIREKNAHEET